VTAEVETPHEYAVLARHDRFTGPMFSVVTDDVAMPGGVVAARDYMRHVGAVAAVALDDAGRVVLVRQYRHPVRRFLWELPAGLVDVAGEPAATTAARELAEEADLLADRWDLLLDLHSTPGCSDELIRVFLARGLRPVPDHDLHVRHDEEAELTTSLIDLDEAVAMVFAGEITNGPCTAGLLAAARARDCGWAGLRPPDTPAPSRPESA
jgi:ADP-ribose pyrophosphatase